MGYDPLFLRREFALLSETQPDHPADWLNNRAAHYTTIECVAVFLQSGCPDIHKLLNILSTTSAGYLAHQPDPVLALLRLAASWVTLVLLRNEKPFWPSCPEIIDGVCRSAPLAAIFIETNLKQNDEHFQ